MDEGRANFVVFKAVVGKKSWPAFAAALLLMRQFNMLNRFKLRRSRVGGNPVAYVVKSLDPRLRGDDVST